MDEPDGGRLLLVEDQPADANVVKRLLVENRGDFGAREQAYAVEIDAVEHVTCLADALERLSAGGIDVVLLDLGLPDSDGLETVAAVVEQRSTAPVIVLTGQKGMGVDAIQQGAQDYLLKGQITPDVLVRTITYAIERARITRDLFDRNHRLALVNEILRADLRNDMSMIVGWGDQLQATADSTQQPAVNAILEASQHALELTDTAAALMDILSEAQTIEPKPCEVVAVLSGAIERCRREYEIDLTVDWGGADQELVSVAGTTLLESVFAHLLTNAAVHTDKERPAITVSVRPTEEQVTVSVADDGFGMSAAQKKRLTETDTTDDRTGVGTGLYFVTTVLESIDGKLSVEDNKARGTVVTVTLKRLDSVPP